MSICIKVENVRKSYGEAVALHDVSLEMKKGEILGFLGPNGAGKTTFIKILATLLTKDSGNITILDRDIDEDVDEIRHLFGYVGQDTERSAYARLSVAENLKFFGALRGMSTEQIDSQIEKLASYFNFHENLEKQFMLLSGGQKQTVVIMRALLHDPPLVYLDEPTKGLDPVAAKRLRNFLKMYAYQEGKSLLLTSHIMSEVDEMASRVALIDKGRIAVVGTPQELKDAVGVNEYVELNRQELPASVQEQILELEPVLFKRDRHEEWVSYGVNDLFDGTEAILRTLKKKNVRVPMRHHVVSLEDAFLHHVGGENHRFD